MRAGLAITQEETIRTRADKHRDRKCRETEDTRDRDFKIRHTNSRSWHIQSLRGDEIQVYQSYLKSPLKADLLIPAKLSNQILSEIYFLWDWTAGEERNIFNPKCWNGLNATLNSSCHQRRCHEDHCLYCCCHMSSTAVSTKKWSRGQYGSNINVSAETTTYQPSHKAVTVATVSLTSRPTQPFFLKHDKIRCWWRTRKHGGYFKTPGTDASEVRKSWSEPKEGSSHVCVSVSNGVEWGF